jgi:hypothetical protein
MAITKHTLEKEVEALAARVQKLELQLEQLALQIVASRSVTSPLAGKISPEGDHPAGEEDVSEEMLSWVGQSSFLPRLATLCFTLVIALILRTLTDSELVSNFIGSVLGMSYASALIFYGWYKYGKASPLAPIFCASGAILMAAIVVETHAHFQSLSLVPAYLTLMATGIGMALISRQFNTFLPISVGILSMCFAGAAIDYPHPYFPYLSLVLFTSNVLGYFAVQLKRCSWLRWSVLVVTMIMLQLWGFRLGKALRRGEIPSPELAVSWFLPIMTVFAVTYLLLALAGILRSNTGKLSRFDLALPTLTVLWAFSAALYVVGAPGGNTYLLGFVGVVTAVALLAETFWLAHRNVAGAPGAHAFAAMTLLALILPAAIGSFTFSLPLVAIVSFFMAMKSRIWGEGAIRGTTYLLQLYCTIALVFALFGDSATALKGVNILPAGILAAVILAQHQWCRKWPPIAASGFFPRFDPKDYSAGLLLMAGLVCSFFMIRIILYQGLVSFAVSVPRDAFRCGQSILINLAAIGLIILAYKLRNKELRNIAIFITVIGGVKVFLYDLLGAHGLPLVFSVFSFGMAAAVESVTLGRWMKGADMPKEPSLLPAGSGGQE